MSPMNTAIWSGRVRHTVSCSKCGTAMVRYSRAVNRVCFTCREQARTKRAFLFREKKRAAGLKAEDSIKLAYETSEQKVSPQNGEIADKK